MYHVIPAGAIKVQLPEVQQPNEYFCGPGAAMASAAKYLIGPERIEEFAEKLATTAKDGTYYGKIADYLNQLGLDASVKTEMSQDELKAVLDEGVPVILSIQAYAADPAGYDDPDSNGDGHFVVAIGFDEEDYFYFMDPSLHGRFGFLAWDELDKRWHENEGIDDEVELSHHLAIIVRGNGHPSQYGKQARHID